MAQTISSTDHTTPATGAKRSSISEEIVCGMAAVYDVAVILGTGFFVYLIWLSNVRSVHWPDYAIALLFGALVAFNLFQFSGTYRFESLIEPASSLRRVSTGWIGVTVILIAVGFFTKLSDSYSRVWSVSWFFSAWAGLLFGRAVLHARSRQWVREGRLSRSVAVVGTSPIGRRLVEYFTQHPDSGVRVVGVFDDDRREDAPHPPKTSYAGPPFLGDLDALERFVRVNPLDTVIIAISPEEEDRLLAITAKLKTLPVDVRMCPGMVGFNFDGQGVSYFGHLPLFNIVNRPLSDWQMMIKAIEDRVVSTLILVAIAPLMTAIAVAIKFDSPGPVFFRQRRYGFNNGLIEVFKFRTMHHDQRDDNADQLTRRGDPRVTRLGAFLRATSLDELPQFFNVLRGEMSIVGPRPHALSAKAAGRLYDEAVRDYASRHRVKPGITGWAQVNGWRGETETLEQIRKRVEHDLVYIENWSLWLDLKIIGLTILRGFTGDKAY
jgi:Undecaprenyl-phosphate glucose phosphotransferase